MVAAERRVLELESELASFRLVSAIPDTESAAYALLQELSHRIPFDWAAVVSLRPDGGRVLATYPRPIGGIETGVSWIVLARTERALLEFGEPRLESKLHGGPDEQSPFSRLTHFGFESALWTPLFSRGGVVGAVFLYGSSADCFSAKDGFAVDRYVYALGAAIDRGIVNGSDRQAEPLTRNRGLRASVTGSREEGATEPRPQPAADRMALLREFSLLVAHELNNPLASVLGWAQLLPELNDEEQRRALEVIEREAQRAGRVMRELLEFASPRSEGRETFDLMTLVAAEIGARGARLHDDRIAVGVALRGPAPVTANHEQIRRAIAYLLDDAHDAIRDMPQPRLLINVDLADGNAHVTVADNRPHVDDTTLTRLFEPFAGGAGTAKGAFALAAPYGLILANGGAMHADRTSDDGLAVVVEIPTVAPALS